MHFLWKVESYHTFYKKISVLSIICSKCENEDEKKLKEEESIGILKILGLDNKMENTIWKKKEEVKNLD